MVALNDTILRDILGDDKGPKKDWFSRSQETDPEIADKYNKFLASKAAEQGYEQSKKAEEKENKRLLKGLKTFRIKGGTSKPIGGEDYTPSIVSGLETYDEHRPPTEELIKETTVLADKLNPKGKYINGEKFNMSKYTNKVQINPVPIDVLRLIDPNKSKYPKEWKETETAQPFSYKIKQVGKTFLTNLADSLPGKNKPSTTSETMNVDGTPLKVVEKPVLTKTDVENRLAVHQYEDYLKNRAAKEKYNKSFRGQLLNVVQSPGLKNFGSNVAENLSTGMGSSIIGSFQDPKTGAAYKLAVNQLKGYQQYLMKKYKTGNDWNATLAKLQPQEFAKIEKLQENALNKQQIMASSGFAGRGGGQLSLMGSSRPINIQRFTAIGPTGGVYGSYSPEAMARLAVGQSLESLSTLNKVRAFGWGERGSSVPGLLGAPTMPIMPTDRVAAFTKMNIRSDRISELLGKPSPILASDIKSKMRRIMNKKY